MLSTMRTPDWNLDLFSLHPYTVQVWIKAKEGAKGKLAVETILPFPHSPLHYFVLHPVLFVCCVVDIKAARKGSLSGAGEQFNSYKLFSILATAIMFLIPL